MPSRRGAGDRKLRELVLYVATKTRDDPHMGSMKLNKVLFHAETRAYLRLRKPISGHPYVKREKGPAPKHFTNIRANLELSKRIRLGHENVGAPKKLDRIVPLDEPDRSLFSDEELAVIDEVIEEMRAVSGTAASEETHLLPGWLAVPLGEEIPFETAFVSLVGTDREHRRVREIAKTLQS